MDGEKWSVDATGVKDVSVGQEIKGRPLSHFFGEDAAKTINNLLHAIQKDPDEWSKAVKTEVLMHEGSPKGTKTPVRANMVLRAIGVTARPAPRN